MEFSRQEYWSRLPFLSPGDLPNPGIEPGSLALLADALPSEPPGKSQKTEFICDFPGGPVVKNPPTNAGDMCSIPGLGRSHMLQNN